VREHLMRHNESVVFVLVSVREHLMRHNESVVFVLRVLAAGDGA
jgi:hypothetical protein